MLEILGNAGLGIAVFASAAGLSVLKKKLREMSGISVK